jgi:hypothetical protein
MKPWLAIIFTIGLVAVVYGVSLVINFNLFWFLILGTSLWAAIDSSKLQLSRYRSSISGPPVMVFIGCAFLWLVVFPWYLSMRYSIQHGTAVLKSTSTSIPGADAIG